MGADTMSKTLWALFLLGLFASSITVFAQEDDDVEEDEADSNDEPSLGDLPVETESGAVDVEEDQGEILPPEHPNAGTTILFPDYPDGKFLSGEKIDVLIGFSNTHDQSFNISKVIGRLHSPYDFKYFIQNFTTIYPEIIVAPSEQTTIGYTIDPDANLDSRDYQFSVVVFFNHEPAATGGNFSSTVFNSTVFITESQITVDTRQFFSYALGIAIMALFVFGLYKFALASLFKKKGGKSSRAASASLDEDWLNHIPAHMKGGGKKADSKKKK
eukprot:JP436250.1.p1 GENE.JP436250.1~~JP436250.1.p1  ORF type:complete len:272 (-),score=99.94 JP436250.1:94-909(-)